MARGGQYRVTLLLTPSTATKRVAVEMAYEECSLAGYEFDVTPEELFSGLRRMDGLMGEWQSQGLTLNYNFPDVFGQGDLDDPIGVPDSALNAISMYLARRIAPMMGKQQSAETRAAMTFAMAGLRALAASIPKVYPSYGTVRGAGNRQFGYAYRSPFLRVGPPVVEATPIVPPEPPYEPALQFNNALNSMYLGIPLGPVFGTAALKFNFKSNSMYVPLVS